MLRPSLIANIENRFASFKDISVYPALQPFNVLLWTDAIDTYIMIGLDVKKLETLAVRFNNLLEKYKFDLHQRKKDWIRVR